MAKQTSTHESLGENGALLDEQAELMRERLVARMKELGLSQGDVTAAADIPRDTISRFLLRRTQSINPFTLAKIARVLKVTVDWLIGSEETGVPGLTDAAMGLVDRIPVIGAVQAGAFQPVPDFVDESLFRKIEIVRHPKFAHFRHFAFDVVGDSMILAGIADGDIVVCIDWIESGLTGMPGMIVVVERSINGGHLREWTVKQMDVLPDRYILNPRSNNQIHKPIEIMRDHHADNGVEVRIIGLVVNSIKNMFKF